MNWFPQLSTGSAVQFPFQRHRTWRSIENHLESGERISLPDTSGGRIDWRLEYHELSDSEAQKLSDLFAVSSGSFGAFGFIDPFANLIGWSEDLNRPDWQPGLLTKSQTANDPWGRTGAWSLHNGSAGSQSLIQTLGVPGEYMCCFSAWVRSDSAGTVFLARDAAQIATAIGPSWRRVFVNGVGVAASQNSTVSIAISAGQSIDVWGFQAEAQPWPSQYRPATAARGIYPETYFATDELRMTATGVGLTSCELSLISRT